MSGSNWWQEDSAPGDPAGDAEGPPPPPAGTSQVNARWDWSAPSEEAAPSPQRHRGRPDAGPQPRLSAAPPVTGPLSALRVAIENVSDFQGRATRGEFWWMWLSMFVINVVAAFAIEALWASGALGAGAADAADLGMLLVSAIIVIPTGVRRMHDSNRSGWWVIVPVINIVLSLMPSDPQANRFGPPRHLNG